jgi:hypothetical protein
MYVCVLDWRVGYAGGSKILDQFDELRGYKAGWRNLLADSGVVSL